MNLDDFLSNVVATSPQQRWFLHFTDACNLASLKKYGILSSRELRRRQIPGVRFGGNQWSLDRDLATGMDAYVHLGFKTGHPMEKRCVDEGTIQKLAYLRIDPAIIKEAGVLITDDVSNKSGVNYASAAKMLDKIDLEVLYRRMRWEATSSIREQTPLN